MNVLYRDFTMVNWLSFKLYECECKLRIVCFHRTGGSSAEVSPVLVRVRSQVSGVDVLPRLAEAEGVGEVHGEWSLPGSGHHHLHRPQHALHGTGTLSHDRRVQQDAVRGQPGERDVNIMCLPMIKLGCDSAPVRTVCFVICSLFGVCFVKQPSGSNAVTSGQINTAVFSTEVV